MEIEIADSETYRPLLEADIRRHATRPVTLLIVDDIAQWAAVMALMGGVIGLFVLVFVSR